jgi:hypothetical protein
VSQETKRQKEKTRKQRERREGFPYTRGFPQFLRSFIPSFPHWQVGHKRRRVESKTPNSVLALLDGTSCLVLKVLRTMNHNTGNLLRATDNVLSKLLGILQLVNSNLSAFLDVSNEFLTMQINVCLMKKGYSVISHNQWKRCNSVAGEVMIPQQHTLARPLILYVWEFRECKQEFESNLINRKEKGKTKTCSVSESRSLKV